MASNTDSREQINLLSNGAEFLGADEELIRNAIYGNTKGSNTDSRAIIGLLKLLVELLEAGGGGGEGTTNYNRLLNKPSINGIELRGALSSEDLQLLNEDDVAVIVNALTSDFATRSEIPENVSELNNDEGYVKRVYVDLKRKGDYLYEIQFDNIPPINNSFPATFGACSTFLKDGKVYRNLDFDYTENTSFIVHTPKFKGMSFIDGLYDEEMTQWDMDKVAQLPNRVVDGINNSGLIVTTHLVFNDNLYTGYTGSDGIPIYQVPSLLLSNCKSLNDVRNWIISNSSKIAIPQSMQENEYTLIFFIRIGSYTYSLQPFEGQYSLFDLSSQVVPKLTNFVSLGTDTIEKSNTDLQARPTGLERYNLINSGATLEDLRFTKAYESSDRLSEFIGINGTTKNSSDSDLLTIYNQAKTIYDKRTRNGLTWQTMHSVIYNPLDNSMEINVQENWNKTYNVPEKIGAEVIVDTQMSNTSENPVQNKVIKSYVDSHISGTVELTEEHLTGETYNGKPVYEISKVYTGRNISASGIVIETIDENVEHILSLTGYFNSPNTINNLPFGYSGSSDFVIGWVSPTRNLTVACSSTYSNRDVYYTLKYTKTTDDIIQSTPRTVFNVPTNSEESINSDGNLVFDYDGVEPDMQINSDGNLVVGSDLDMSIDDRGHLLVEE